MSRYFVARNDLLISRKPSLCLLWFAELTILDDGDCGLKQTVIAGMMTVGHRNR
jgi:hypothetical protein